MLKRSSKVTHGLLATTIIATGLVMAGPGSAQNVDAETLRQLQEIIQAQQEQMQKQQETLEALQQQVQELQAQEQRQELRDMAAEAQKAAEEAKMARSEAQAASVEAQTAAGTSDRAGATVVSGSEKVSLVLSGQVNRMVNIADDGESTKIYHVDNDASSTRFRLVANANVTEKFTLGANIELEAESNSSGDVSQDDQETSFEVKERIMEVDLAHTDFGRLRIGQGSTASDNTSQIDFSRTSVIAYSSVSDQAGGLKFRDSDGNLLDVRIKNVFNDFDGLSRRDRVRYDSPKFWGFQASGSLISDDRWDLALRWAGQGYGVKAAAAAAVSDSQESQTNNTYNGSFSVLHENTGLNLTFSTGMKERTAGRHNASSFYVKGGWITEFFKFGETAMAIDYSNNQDVGQNGDDAQMFRASAVQFLSDFGTEFYATVANFDLDRRQQSTDDITVGSIGTRVKF